MAGSLVFHAMKYQLREDETSRQQYSEYSTLLTRGFTTETEEVLTETILSISGVTVPTNSNYGDQPFLLAGKTVSEQSGDGSGWILWAEVDSSGAGKLGIQLTTPATSTFDTDGGGAVLDGDPEDTFTILSATNLIERIEGLPTHNFCMTSLLNVTNNSIEDEYYIDVRAIEKIIISHVGSSGYLRLCHEETEFPLSPWLRTGEVFVLSCEQKYFHLIVESTEESIAYALAESPKIIGSGALATWIGGSRRLTPPQTDRTIHNETQLKRKSKRGRGRKKV